MLIEVGRRHGRRGSGSGWSWPADGRLLPAAEQGKRLFCREVHRLDNRAIPLLEEDDSGRVGVGEDGSTLKHPGQHLVEIERLREVDELAGPSELVPGASQLLFDAAILRRTRP